MTQISRRTLAKGAAWAAPVVAASAVVPAYASSTDKPYGGICDIFFGSGNANAQRTVIGLSVITPNGMMKKGDTVSWVFDATSARVPGLNYSKSGRWSLSVTPPERSNTDNGKFTVTLVANQEISTSEVNCIASLLWDSSSSSNSSNITPGSTIKVSSSNGTDSYGLTVTIPRRNGKVNDRQYKPVRIDGSCYPTIKFSYLGNSTRYNQDTEIYFNGNKLPDPTGDDGNNQPITYGTCEGSRTPSGAPRSAGDISTGG
ncbi:hypothetical protein ACN081_05720 [Rothia sp. P13129]|uniref:hypothetical protein n=1 Tax=Rothia sp. P13129 TaxID=3402664 RepID=UPI003AD361CB